MRFRPKRPRHSKRGLSRLPRVWEPRCWSLMMPMAQKTVADEIGVEHQVCKAHVLRNTEALIDKYQYWVAKDADGSRTAIGVSSQQAADDLRRLGELVKSRQREQATELEAIHRRYLEASPPREGEHQSLAYRLRLLFLDRLPPLASLNALPHVERTQSRNPRWHQQCLGARHRLVGQRALSQQAWLQGARACGGCQSEAFLVWQLPQCGGRSHAGRTLAVSKNEQGSSRLVLTSPPLTNYRTITYLWHTS